MRYRQSYLRQSISRISIHRSKKLTSIAKKKDDIAKHLESGNEVNAKIWVLKIFIKSMLNLYCVHFIG